MNDDIHTLSGAYAVDAVDDLERARFEQHLAVCPECRAEVGSLRNAAFELSHLVEFMPPARLREQVLRDITAVRPLPPRVDISTQQVRAAAPATPRRAPHTQPTRAEARAQSRWSTRWVAAAAAVALFGGGAAAVTHPWDRQSQGQLTVADRVLGAPDKQSLDQAFPGGASATLVRSAEVGRAVLVTRDMPRAPGGKVYEMWLKNAQGTVVPAGLMPHKSDQTVLLDGDASTATWAGITIEPEGGSSTPTTTPVASFAFV